MTLEATLIAAYRYWCGELSHETDYPADKAEIWFKRQDETDLEIRRRFGADLDAVAAEQWDVASLPREAQIGLIVFLDQFPRNLFRDDAKAFAFDPLARRYAAALLPGDPRRFALVERTFLYLPFEHSEALADQIRSVELYAALLADAPEDQKKVYQDFLDYAVKHRELIERFGRFPHRNVDLGRVSTPEEAAFLAEHGRGY